MKKDEDPGAKSIMITGSFMILVFKALMILLKGIMNHMENLLKKKLF